MADASGSSRKLARVQGSRLRSPYTSIVRWQPMSKCILVVEDQEDNRRILRDLLGNAGYELIEVESGEDALAAVMTRRPDLILMDIQLPAMDGYEAAQRI